MDCCLIDECVQVLRLPSSSYLGDGICCCSSDQEYGSELLCELQDQGESFMRRVLSVLLASMIGTVCAEAGVVISIANQTVNANSTFNVDVFAIGTGGTGGTNYFALEFQVVSASGANPGVAGQLSHTTPAGVPTFSNSSYVFNGDSLAETTWAGGTGSSSWSVSSVGWTNDTYIVSDMTNSGSNAPLLTSRYLATLYFTVGATAAGEYKVVLGSSEFDVDDANPVGEVPAYPVMDTGSNAGIFTVNGGGGSPVPEPGTAVVGGLLLTGVVYWRRRSLPRGA